MRRRWIIPTIVVVVALAAGIGFVEYTSGRHHEPAPQGESKPLTLAEVEDQARVDLPEGSKLLYAEFYVLDDWAVAARVQFDRKALNGFLSASGLPAVVDGLRPVPVLPDVSTVPPQPTGTPSDGASGAPAGSVAPSGGTSGTAAPAPSDLPSPAVPLLRDDPGWHPEQVVHAAGVDRDVQDGVARWVMVDLDAPDTVVVYLYATAEQPVASTRPSPTPSRSPATA
ncbi:MAG TPA: hypothetical protein VF054_02380 [Micromonosporaceae bacterium]